LVSFISCCSSQELIRSQIVKRNQHRGKFLYCCRLCLINKATPYQSNQFQGFQHHVTQEHGHHELSNSKHGLFVIAGLHHQDGDSNVSLSSMHGNSNQNVRCIWRIRSAELLQKLFLYVTNYNTNHN